MIINKTVCLNFIKKQEYKIDPIRSKFGEIEKEEVNLIDKIKYIDEIIKREKKFSFRNLLVGQTGKMDVIVTFLGILEMIRMGRIFISQENTFDDIYIEYNNDAEDLDENYDISFE